MKETGNCYNSVDLRYENEIRVTIFEVKTLCCLLAVALAAGPTWAIPPLVSGDIPTADHGTYELFFGYVLKDGGIVTEEELPFWELVYGLTSVQELTIEAPIVRRDDLSGTTTGLGDVIIGTKYRLLGKPSADSGLSASLEVSLPTGDEQRGLGSGAVDVDLKARGGWQLGCEVVYFNLGHTWVGEERKDNTWFYSGVWDHPVRRNLRLLTEVYGKTANEPGAPNALAGTVGIKWRLAHRQQLQFSIGRSLRHDRVGGPDLRVYAGWRRDFGRN